MNSVLVYQPWGIGDMVMTLPMLAEIRRLAPEARICLATASLPSKLLSGADACDEVIPAPEGQGPSQLARFCAEVRRHSPDCALIPVGISRLAAPLLRWGAGIPVVAGGGPGGGLAHTIWTTTDACAHRVETNAAILGALLPGARPVQPGLPLSPVEREEASREWNRLGLSAGPVVGFHPGGGYRQLRKRLPEDLLKASLGLLLEMRRELRAAVFAGPDEDELSSRYAGVHPRCVVIRGRSLRQTAALLGRVAVFVSGDTGLGHVASAVGVRVLTLAGPTRISATRPYSDGCRVLTARQPPICMPCYGSSLYDSCGHVSCLNDIRAPDIVAGVDALLESARERTV